MGCHYSVSSGLDDGDLDVGVVHGCSNHEWCDQ